MPNEKPIAKTGYRIRVFRLWDINTSRQRVVLGKALSDRFKHADPTLDSICRLTREEMLKLPGVGPRAVDDFSIELNKVGKALKGEVIRQPRRRK